MRHYLLFVLAVICFLSLNGQGDTIVHVFRARAYRTLGQEGVNYKFVDSLYLENGKFKVVNINAPSQCLFTGYFKNYQKQGNWTYYHTNGQVSSTFHYENDVLQGIARTYNEDGTLVAEVNHKDGEMHGPFFWEDFMYKLGITYGQFDNGVPSGVWKFINKGILQLEIDYSRGVENQIITYYTNGKWTTKEIYHNKQLIKTEKAE